LLGAQLTGAHEGVEERAIEPIGGWWSTSEIKAREDNRLLLLEVLGVKEFDRALFFGKSLSGDEVYDLAMGRIKLDDQTLPWSSN